MKTKNHWVVNHKSWVMPFISDFSIDSILRAESQNQISINKVILTYKSCFLNKYNHSIYSSLFNSLLMSHQANYISHYMHKKRTKVTDNKLTKSRLPTKSDSKHMYRDHMLGIGECFLHRHKQMNNSKILTYNMAYIRDLYLGRHSMKNQVNTSSYFISHTKKKSFFSFQGHSLTSRHLRKAKLMFLYVRYPNSSILKDFFPDITFDKNSTAQLVKWFSNFR